MAIMLGLSLVANYLQHVWPILSFIKSGMDWQMTSFTRQLLLYIHKAALVAHMVRKAALNLYTRASSDIAGKEQNLLSNIGRSTLVESKSVLKILKKW